MKLFQLLFINFRGASFHEAFGILRLWKCDDFPDGFVACQYCANPVEAECDASVGRGPKPKSFQQKAKFLVGLLLIDHYQREYLLLEFRAVDPYRAAANLDAIYGYIIGFCPCLFWVLVQ